MEHDMRPPYSELSFSEMNKEQTKEYFDWYLSQIPKRIKLLANSAMTDGVLNVFDYSPDSLIPIWEWYETKISYRMLSHEELISEMAKHPEWMKGYIADKDISYETLNYCLDLAVYFAEVIIKNSNRKIKWGYFTKPKNKASVNEPTLIGFNYNMDLNPRVVVLNCTRKSARESKKSRLKDMYDIWMKRTM